MDNPNSDKDNAWVEERIARLSPPPGWKPDADQAFDRIMHQGEPASMSRGLRLSLAGATLAVIGVVVALLPWQVLWTPETTEKPASTQRIDSAAEASQETTPTTETTKSPAAPVTPQDNAPKPEAVPLSTTPPPTPAPSQGPRPKKAPRFYASAEEQAGIDIMQRQNAVAALETPGEPLRGAQAPGPQPSPDGVTPPIAIFQVQPQYTPEARLARVQGTVELAVTVREDGSVKFERITQSLGFGLDESSAAAVEQWKFVPGKKNGQPVAVSTTLRFHFSLK